MGRIKTVQLLADFKGELFRILDLLPEVLLIISEVFPKLAWTFHDTVYLDRIRKRLNRSLSKFIPLLNGFSFRHVDLEDLSPGFFLDDYFNLSPIGIDIFNLGIASMVEVGLRRFGVGALSG